jgi:hypothetical protein
MNYNPVTDPGRLWILSAFEYGNNVGQLSVWRLVPKGHPRWPRSSLVTCEEGREFHFLVFNGPHASLFCIGVC